MKRKTLMSWSTGKDSAWALYQLQQDPETELAGLFCTVNQQFNRVAMHGVRDELLQMQAQLLGLPLQIIEIPYPCSNAEYESKIAQFVAKAKAQGVLYFAFGDLFLQDIRQYREDKLSGTGIKPVFPLWGRPTDTLSKEIINGGLQAVITCVDPKQIAKEFVGKQYDLNFLQTLPSDVDPCGENGEFHSFVFNGPMFKRKIGINVGESILRDGFVFVDLEPDLSGRSGE